MPTLREILAGYEAANAWEQGEEERELPALTVETSIRQYIELHDFARQVAPDAEEFYLNERLAHYEELHRKLEKAAKVMGRVDSN
jgi:hypothetical protein